MTSLRNDCRFEWVQDLVRNQVRLNITLPFAVGDALLIISSIPSRRAGIFLGIHQPYSDQVIVDCPPYDVHPPKIPAFFVDLGFQMVPVEAIREVIRGSDAPLTSSFSLPVDLESESGRMWSRAYNDVRKFLPRMI